MSVAITLPILLALGGAALCLRPPRRAGAHLLAAAHATVVPAALLTMLALLVSNVGWACTALASGLATSVALWVLRAPTPAVRPEPRGGDGGWGHGGRDPRNDGDDPTSGLHSDWAAFERDALAAWRAHQDRQALGV